jgi:hypothetical protein
MKISPALHCMTTKLSYHNTIHCPCGVANSRMCQTPLVLDLLDSPARGSPHPLAGLAMSRPVNYRVGNHWGGVNYSANELSCRRLRASFSKTEGAHGKRERDSRRMLACEGTRGRVWERYMLRRGGRVCLGHGGENGGGREVSGRWGIRCLCSQSSARKGIRFLFRSRCRRRRLNWRGRRCGRFRGRGLCRRNGRS